MENSQLAPLLSQSVEMVGPVGRQEFCDVV